MVVCDDVVVAAVVVIGQDLEQFSLPNSFSSRQAFCELGVSRISVSRKIRAASLHWQRITQPFSVKAQFTQELMKLDPGHSSHFPA